MMMFGGIFARTMSSYGTDGEKNEESDGRKDSIEISLAKKKKVVV